MLTSVLGCKGSGFVYDKNFGLLRVYGTLDKCLGQSESKEVWVKQCSLVGDVGFRNGLLLTILTRFVIGTVFQNTVYEPQILDNILCTLVSFIRKVTSL